MLGSDTQETESINGPVYKDNAWVIPKIINDIPKSLIVEYIMPNYIMKPKESRVC